MGSTADRTKDSHKIFLRKMLHNAAVPHKVILIGQIRQIQKIALNKLPLQAVFLKCLSGFFQRLCAEIQQGHIVSTLRHARGKMPAAAAQLKQPCSGLDPILLKDPHDLRGQLPITVRQFDRIILCNSIPNLRCGAQNILIHSISPLSVRFL